MEDKDKNKNKRIENKELGEDATKYGEIVSSYFGWITPSKQKERVGELEDLGKKHYEKIRKSEINEENKTKSKKNENK